MSSKKCPFCKEEISISDTTCPKCQRVLVETIRNFSSNNNAKQQQKSSSENKKLKTIFLTLVANLKNLWNKSKSKFKRKEKIYTYQFDRWKKYKRFFGLSVIIIIFVLIFYFDDNSDDNSPNRTSQLPNIPKSNNYVKPESEYTSLPNGTLLNSSPLYLEGLGELKIENGTNMDAVAKLVKNYPRKSIYTVYIKAKSSYKITEISDGNYALYFAHGRDWDKLNEKFLVNRSFSKFEDSFDYITKKEYLSDGINTRYTTFEVTLHPVVGGSAETNQVPENEFNKF